MFRSALAGLAGVACLELWWFRGGIGSYEEEEEEEVGAYISPLLASGATLMIMCLWSGMIRLPTVGCNLDAEAPINQESESRFRPLEEGTALDECLDQNDHEGPYNSAIANFNQQVSPADHVALPVPPTFRQQLLSRALDRVTALRLGSAGQGREAFRAHFQLQRQPHAGSWLQAPPCEALGLHVESPLFRIMIRRRLRLPVADEDIPCPLCDPVMDRFGDHALVCACGGDRVKRHNRLRSLLASRAKTAGLDSEVEKPGLLPPRLDAHGGPEDGAAGWRPQTR
ncbi:hypothetical protein AK812_SmicGene40337 [Symbiodinium microadriaticum]|uniref:Uncharacterized protein n=1 Tax=Symbiodinium microadriaticum TaxID=2951 RepID=A0A1Q9C8Y4_SYMMI|nr:hypothetical protein AK812_SmicGene40337 [Symbiodinium microadriaticum]